MPHNKKVGKIGESIARKFLLDQDFIILDMNVTSRWGEIDIVASKRNALHFIEVKTRIGLLKGKPYESVNYFKLKTLGRSIEYYLLKNKIKNTKLSLDVVSIVLDEDLSLNKLDYYENVEGG